MQASSSARLPVRTSCSLTVGSLSSDPLSGRQGVSTDSRQFFQASSAPSCSGRPRSCGLARPGGPGRKSTFLGWRVSASEARHHNGSMRHSMSRWLENKAQIDVPIALELAWALWDDRERIPKWMPWIKSVKVLEQDPRLSRWTLSTHQFGRDWEFSWLARNLQPVKNQKIHWVSEPGSTSMPGVEIANQGQIRFVRKGPELVSVTLTISYEVPDVLAPFAQALTPLVESIIGRDMVRFKDYALDYKARAAAAAATKAAAKI